MSASNQNYFTANPLPVGTLYQDQRNVRLFEFRPSGGGGDGDYSAGGAFFRKIGNQCYISLENFVAPSSPVTPTWIQLISSVTIVPEYRPIADKYIPFAATNAAGKFFIMILAVTTSGSVLLKSLGAAALTAGTYPVNCTGYYPLD